MTSIEFNEAIHKARTSVAEFQNLLTAIGACEDGRKWAAGKTLDQAWKGNQGFYMYWFVRRLAQRRFDLGLIDKDKWTVIWRGTVFLWGGVDGSFTRGTKTDKAIKDRLARAIRTCFAPDGQPLV
jgi:hypothetical protein